MRYFTILILLISSCIEGGKTLPQSTGTNSEVIFVVADFLWESQIKDLVSNSFGSSIEGLNQNETSFRVVHVNHSEFKSILKTHKNIVIISKDVMQSSQQNKWAYNQLVSQLNWQENTKETQISLNKLKVIYEQKELKAIRKSFAKTSQKNNEELFNNNFGIEVIIPKKYKVIYNSDSIFWATFNPTKSEEINNILSFSFNPCSSNLQEEVLQKTDSVFAKYLEGEKIGSFVRIEPQYPPYYNDNIYRGLWKLEKGFMGGPFLIKTYFIENKLVVNVGLIFAPQSRKRNFIKEIEAIL